MTKQKQKDLHEAYRQTFKSESGKQVLDDLMKRFNLLRPTFDADARVHAFLEGERNVVLTILDMVSMSEAEFEKRYAAIRQQSTLEWTDE